MFKPVVKNTSAGNELLWRSIKIRKSLDEICHTLELEVPPSERLKVHRHDRLEVRCENPLVRDSGGFRPVTTVLVDEVTAAADTEKHSLSVTGRSPARDIVDSAWTEDYGDQTLSALTRSIGKKFNIELALPHGDKTVTVKTFLITDESPWPKLVNEADSQGYIFCSNELGGLYLWQAQGPGRTEPFEITEGKNIKSIKWTENGSEQFHEYILKGGENDPVSVIDAACPGSRILSISIDDPFIDGESLLRRAKTEMLRRKETKTVASVPGWGLTDSQIKSLGETAGLEIYWVPNLLIPVKIPALGLDDNLLISEVEYTATADTMGCDLTLVNRGAYL